MALTFRDLKCENRLCAAHIFSLFSDVTFNLLSFIRHTIADNLISHSLNAAVVLQQLCWLIGAELSGVGF